MKLNLSQLPENLISNTKEILQQLKIPTSDKGYVVTAEVGDCFKVSFDGKTFSIVYSELRFYYRAFLLIKKNGDESPYEIKETCGAKELGIMLDVCRNAVCNINHFKKIVRLLALMGYNQIQLYTEDTYEVKNEPYFGYMRGRYTISEMKEIDDYAYSYGVEIVPCIQTLAHFRTLFRWPDYEPIHDVSDIMMIGEERTYKLIENMLSTLSECFRSRKIHLGMDEAHLVGRGAYEDKNGAVKDRIGLMINHLNKIIEIANKFNYEPMIWSDMFFRFAFNVNYYTANTEFNFSEDVIAKLPKNLRLVYWDYYNCEYKTYDNMFRLHKQLTDDIMFGGGAWTWTGYTPQNDWSIKTTALALQACKAYNCDKIMFTMWGDDGAECSALGVLPTLCYASEYLFGHKDSYSDVFYALTGITLEDYSTLDLPNKLDVNQAPHVNNRAKYMLFNNMVGGLFDCYAQKGQGEIYKEHAEKIAKAEKNAGEYSYLFATQRALCEVLSLKFDFGAKLRIAYKNKDKDEMRKLSDCIPKMLEYLNGFYSAFRKQWLIENKSIGLEVQDVRLGGLIKRAESCKMLLDDYINGKTEKIEELEQEFLPPVNYDIDWGSYINYLHNFTANVP